MSTRLTLALLGVAMAATLAVESLPLDVHVAAGVALAVVAGFLAWSAGLTVADVGVARGTWLSGLRWGGAAAVIVAAGYALTGIVLDSVPEPRYDSTGEALLAVLVLIPLGTVIPEELVFRGVLWGLLRRDRGERIATAVSSVLFGLWHVLSALGGGPANEGITDAVGSGGFGIFVRVVLTVAFTTVAGVVLCWLRARSDSLLAPVMLHWAVNGLGVVFVLLGERG